MAFPLVRNLRNHATVYEEDVARELARRLGRTAKAQLAQVFVACLYKLRAQVIN